MKTTTKTKRITRQSGWRSARGLGGWKGGGQMVRFSEIEVWKAIRLSDTVCEQVRGGGAISKRENTWGSGQAG